MLYEYLLKFNFSKHRYIKFFISDVDLFSLVQEGYLKEHCIWA